MKSDHTAIVRVLGMATAALLMAGCAAQRTFKEGKALVEAGDVPAGLAKVEQARQLDPRNFEYRQYFQSRRDAAVQQALALAEGERQQRRWDEAEALYRSALALDARNARAQSGLESLRADRRQAAAIDTAAKLFEAGDETGARAKVREVLTENSGHRDAQALLRRIEERAIKAAAAGPTLLPALRKPLAMEFRDVPIRTVFELISRNTGLNFIFDRDVRPDLRTTLSVKNSSIEDIIRFVLATNQLERKVLSENTLLIYPNSAAKLRDYQDLVVKTFYLANADVKLTANMIRSLVKTKDMHIDEKLNMLVMRDTPDAIRMAERLVASQDLADPEVMLEVEVLEVGSTVLSELGIRWPTQINYSAVGAAGTAGSLTLPEWNNRSASLVRMAISNPLLALNLKNQEGKTNVLANPRIRVKNKEKAKIHIGDKVPVITTTSTATGFISESVTYLDVGLKLDVEPLISLDNEVGIKVGLEVSNIVRENRSASGSLTYQVGTRNAATTLRLKDGETQVLAGLINDEDRRTADKLPGLGEIPILGRLFGSENKTANKTEIVLLITPRIVRNLARPELRFEEFPGGTEAAVGAAPLLLQSLPLEAGASASATTGGAGATNALPAGQGGGTTGTAANPEAPAMKVLIRGPAALQPGETFTIAVDFDTQAQVRSGLLDFAFDPSRLKFVRAESGSLVANDTNATLRASAPEGLGRLSVNVGTPGSIKGPGEVAKLTFQVLPGAAGSPALRLEAASITDAAGKLLAGQLPPPLALSLAR